MVSNKNLLLRGIGIGVVIVLGLAFVSQTYVKRGMQGRLKAATDDIGDQYTTASYEPYYQKSEYRRVNASQAQALGTTSTNLDIPRKIIKNASMSLKVKDAALVQAKLNVIVVINSGMVVNSELTQAADTSRSGRVVFKVPPAGLENVLAEARKLGEVQSESITGEDITEQYVDLQARLQNFKMVRERLTKILDERAREVKDILEIERELARVGGDIDSLEGRIKYLDRQVDLSTVTVTFFERHAGILKGLDIRDKFRGTLQVSAETFVNTFNGVIVFLSFVLPLSIWCAVFGGLFFIIKNLFRKK